MFQSNDFKNISLSLVTAVIFMGLLSCTKNKDQASPEKTQNAAEHITVNLDSKSDSNVTGTVEFIAEANGVRIKADIKGLKTNSKHGFHIHEKPDCSAEDASSAGDHFNPLEHEHGAPGVEFHAGDLGNLETDGEGRVQIDEVFEHISLMPANPAYIMNRSVVVHADEDDLSSQPAGNAGDRVACGAIVL